MNKALFLDRDGIINIDHGYVYKKEEFDFVEGIFELCLAAQKKGYKIIVITNQAGIARGYYNEEDFHLLTQWMKEKFLQQHITITDVFYCPHHPEEGINSFVIQCQCRKPQPGMILQAQEKYHIDLTQSIFIGDKTTDIQAAENAGINKKILLAGHYHDDDNISAIRIENISGAIQYLD